MQKITAVLQPLARISPSRYSAIKKCPLKVVLANSYPAPLLPYPPANHLGNVIHECLRLLWCKEIRTEEEFENNWKRLQDQEEKILKTMGFDFFLPLSENVPGYTIKKLQVKSLIKRKYKKSEEETKPKSHPFIFTEKWLEAKDGLVGGFADIIFTWKYYIKLSDFKSGKILLEEGQIKEDYEDQLKLYAYLHKEEFGKYPNELSIIDLEKNEYAVNFTPQECENIAVNAKHSLTVINDLVKNNNFESLAKPDSSTCKNCLYRPSCRFYWTLPLSLTDSKFCDIKGRVTEVKQFRNGNLNASLNNGGEIYKVIHLNSRYLLFLEGAIGKEIAFYNLKQNECYGKFEALKTTKIYEV